MVYLPLLVECRRVEKVCSIEGCDKVNRPIIKGLCTYHYESARSKSPITMAKRARRRSTKEFKIRKAAYDAEYISRPEVSDKIKRRLSMPERKAKARGYTQRWKRSEAPLAILYKIGCGLRTRLWAALKNGQRNGSAVRDLGCSIAELKQYLESKFKPGMSWKNYGRKPGLRCWEIDHIIPLRVFDLLDRDQLLRAVHYTNLQPLWHDENLKKRGHYEAP